MYHDINYLLSRLINGPLSLCQVYFISSNNPMPDLACQVDFPRLEIVLEGEFVDIGAGATLVPGDVLYVPTGGWNFPQWQAPATTFSVLFGRQQSGFSVMQQDGRQYQNLAKQHVARHSPRIDSSLPQTLNEMQMQPQERQTTRLIAANLLSHCHGLLSSQIQAASHSQTLSEAICDYIGERHASVLTHESVAQASYISPNYLSHLFQETRAIDSNEYLNHMWLEHAKTLLKGYDLKVEEVAHACSFVDGNYFCRPSRKNIGRSPSEYRRQYHNQLAEKPATPE